MTLAVMLMSALPAQVELRGGMLVSAPVVNVSIQGVEVGGDEPRVIGWDSVKVVLGEHAAAATPFMSIADQAWRARLRLSRGDTELACPLFEDLFRTYQGLNGPTAVMVAEGRVRCMLRQGDQTGAIVPWMEALRLRRAGYMIAGDPPITPVLDEETGLIPALPPIWLGTTDSALLADFKAPKEVDDITRAMGELFAAAARYENGRELGTLPESTHPGVDFVRQIVLARAGNAEQRNAARTKLAQGLETDANTWREAWRRVAIGRSLLREESLDDRTAGVFQLLHLPARFAQTHPYLASIALAESAMEMKRRDDDASAQVLAAELHTLAPDGSADLWLKHRLQTNTSTTTTTQADQSTNSESNP